MLASSSFWADALGRIEPTPSQKAQAKRSHGYLREVLDTGKMATRIKRSYLSGSYARRTAIRPQDDVDIIFVIDPSQWKRPLLARNPSPGDVLDAFARAIRYRYEESRVVTQRRSVRIQLSNINVDAVPAIQDDTDEELIYVPNVDSGFFDEDWIPSRPLRHARIVAELNARHSTRFTRLAKLVKRWNSQLPQTRQLRSFAIETLAATAFHDRTIETYDEALVLFFDFVAHAADRKALNEWPSRRGVCLDSWSSLSLPDLGGTASNLVARVSDRRCGQFVDEAVRARDLLSIGQKRRTQVEAETAIREALRL